MQRIVWLASYPRSGNTWMLLMLNDLIQRSRAGLTLAVGAERLTLERWTGLDFALLSDDALGIARSEAWRDISDSAEGLVVTKVHDAWSDGDHGGVIPTAATHSAIHIVRHPEDVAASLGPFLGIDTNAVVEMLADETLTFGGDELPHVSQHLGSWSSHVASWLDAGLPCLTVRYETMYADPVSCLAGVAAHLELSVTAQEVSSAVEACKFDALQETERNFGSRAPANATDRYFRRGRSGAGAEELTISQRQQIYRDHEQTMSRLGYKSSAPEIS